MQTRARKSGGNRSGLVLGLLLLASLVGIVMIALAASRFQEKSEGDGSALLEIKGADKTVGVLEIKGMILDSELALERIKDLVEHRKVKALIVRIESPGGTIGPTQEIHRELRRLREKNIPVVASFGDVAASGGYYIGSAANKIVANPGTLTGSIGVIMEYLNLQGVFEKIKVKPVVIKSGPYKDMGSPNRDPSKEESELLNGVVQDLYGQFLNDVALGRGLTVDEVRPYADGRVFTGNQALGYKLVDQLGDLKDAVALAGQLAGIQGEPKVIYPRKKRVNFFEALAESGAESLMRLSANIQARESLPSFYFMSGGWAGSGNE